MIASLLGLVSNSINTFVLPSDGNQLAMQKTKGSWDLLCVYLIINGGTCVFYAIAEPSGAVRWILALVIFFFFLLFAMQFYASRRKDALMIAGREEYCRQVEAELKKQLEAGQKKTQFIRNAYHEVRSQFWGVHVISRMLMRATEKGYARNRNKMLADLSSASANLEMLLSNILDYAKYESGISEKPYYEVIDLRRNLAELVEISRYAAQEKNIRINLQASNEIPDAVVCDRVKINQVLTNLINNAINFSNPDSDIFLFLHRDPDRWRISIKDQGRGIPAALLPNIFDQFVTTRQRGRAGEGLGLGLYISRQLVTSLQGEITVHSEEHTGSCFIVSLPILPFEFLSMNDYHPSPEGQ
jgi:signal transduction histidine kinase